MFRRALPRVPQMPVPLQACACRRIKAVSRRVSALTQMSDAVTPRAPAEGALCLPCFTPFTSLPMLMDAYRALSRFAARWPAIQ